MLLSRNLKWLTIIRSFRKTKKLLIIPTNKSVDKVNYVSCYYLLHPISKNVNSHTIESLITNEETNFISFRFLDNEWQSLYLYQW